MLKLTDAMEDYLRTIDELSRKDGKARVSDIAMKLNVSKASVCQAVNVLKNHGLIIKGDDRGISLTAEGIRQVKLISTKHVIIRRFFTEVLKVDPAIADRDACSFEHTISPESLQSIKQYLKQHQE
jgi:Mn-dependent transcriptional regulator